MPYDSLIWGEEVQNNGLAGVTSKGPTGIGYTITGDTIVLKDLPNPLMTELGCVADTKPQGIRLDMTNSGYKFYGPGNVKFWPLGWADQRKAPIKLWRNDTITGYGSNTNVNEGIILGCNVRFGGNTTWDLSQFAGAGQLYREYITITSSAAVTYNSGAVTIYSGATNPTNWFDPESSYYLLGVGGCVSAATFGGMLSITNLGGAWSGYAPGAPITPLSAVDFGVTSDYLFPEPIGPITGDAIRNSVNVGMTASSAGAVTFPMLIAKMK
jgi:hypothetical protein